jgi:hypothetical protein
VTLEGRWIEREREPLRAIGLRAQPPRVPRTGQQRAEGGEPQPDDPHRRDARQRTVRAHQAVEGHAHLPEQEPRDQ